MQARMTLARIGAISANCSGANPERRVDTEPFGGSMWPRRIRYWARDSL